MRHLITLAIICAAACGDDDSGSGDSSIDSGPVPVVCAAQCNFVNSDGVTCQQFCESRGDTCVGLAGAGNWTCDDPAFDPNAPECDERLATGVLIPPDGVTCTANFLTCSCTRE